MRLGWLVRILEMEDFYPGLGAGGGQPWEMQPVPCTARVWGEGLGGRVGSLLRWQGREAEAWRSACLQSPSKLGRSPPS